MLTVSQDKALKLLKSGQNIFLTGGGGTGKSYAISTFEEWLRENGKEVILCAPTGVAAEHIGGQTIHRTFHVPVRLLRPNEPIVNENEYLDYVDVVIIDEISMVRFDVFDYVIRCILRSENRIQKKKQVVVMGDFFQLPPVIGDENVKNRLATLWNREIGKGFAFSSPRWTDMNFLNFSLVDCVRQEDIFFTKIVNEIRLGEKKHAKWINLNAAKEEQRTEDGQLAITLCSKRSVARRINDEETEKLPGEAVVYSAVYTGVARELYNESLGEIQGSNLEHCLTLKIGMRVMACINCSDENYQNGSLGTVTELYEDSVRVLFDNGTEARIYRYLQRLIENEVENNQLLELEVGTIYQLPLRPAYGITIHKSQGCTFEKMNLYPDCFEDGQLYVAISRVKSIKGLHLYEEVSEKDIRVSKEVLKFYETFD